MHTGKLTEPLFLNIQPRASRLSRQSDEKTCRAKTFVGTN